MTLEERFQALLEQSGSEKNLSTGRMFGSQGLKVNGKICAMMVEGRLVLKLPRDRVNSLVNAGKGDYFDPGHGRLMKEWIALQAPNEDEWPGLVEEAKAFAASI